MPATRLKRLEAKKLRVETFPNLVRRMVYEHTVISNTQHARGVGPASFV
jgi:hypothetical protein